MKALVVGGSSGIGLSIVLQLVSRKHIEQVYVLDKQTFPNQYSSDKICAVIHDLAKERNYHYENRQQKVICLNGRQGAVFERPL